MVEHVHQLEVPLCVPVLTCVVRAPGQLAEDAVKLLDVVLGEGHGARQGHRLKAVRDV